MDFKSLSEEKKIVLVGKDLKDGDTEVLVQVLQKGIVEELNLMCNHIALTDDKFTNALAQNSSLKILNLYNNRVGVAGAARLAAALKVNSSLQQLFLEGNQVGDEGAQSLAGALTVNANGTLRVLILRGNGIGDAGARSLGTSFLFNRSLRVVLLGENLIGNRGAQHLVDVLDYNPVIEQLLVDGNSMSNILEQRIKVIMCSGKRKNTDIKKQALPKHIVEALLEEKDNEIARKDLALAAEIATRYAALVAKDEEMAALQKIKNDAITSMKAALRSQETLIKAKELDIEEKDQLLARNGHEISTRDDDIARREAELTQRTMVIAKRDLDVAKRDTKIAALEAKLAAPLELLADFVAHKDAEIAALRATFGEKAFASAGAGVPRRDAASCGTTDEETSCSDVTSDGDDAPRYEKSTGGEHTLLDSTVDLS